MRGDSRVQKSLLNARINTICFFASLILSFFSRRVFINFLGISFLGLTGTLGSILGFLNIAELGIGSAIGYVLYKPIVDDDRLKITEVVSVLGYLYRMIGHFILLAGVVVSLFLPLIFKENDLFEYKVLYFGFYSYLISSLIGYYNNYKQVLLSADQRNYEVTGYYQVVSMITSVLQMLFAYLTKSFLVFFALQLLCGVSYSVILNFRINKVYPWLNCEVSKGRVLLKEYPQIVLYIKQLCFHKIGEFVQFQISPLLIYSFVSLPMVAIYMNYTTISDKLNKFVVGAMDSTLAGVGNLISEGDSGRVWSVFRELMSIRYLVSGIVAACFYYTSSSFVSLWLGEQYVLSSITTLLISVLLFMSIARGAVDQFIYGFGLFSDVWSPIAESIIFVLTSIVFGHFWGLNGILLGPILSIGLIIYIWKPFFLFSRGLKMSWGNYWLRFFIYLAIHIISYWAAIMILHDNLCSNESWLQWIISSSLFLFVYSLIAFLLFFGVSSSFRKISSLLLKRIMK